MLGGHDHHYECKKIQGRWLCKSGTDFREFSRLTLQFDGGKVQISDPERFEVTASVSEDPIVKAVVDKYEVSFKDKMEQEIARTAVNLDGKFSNIRKV